MNEVGITVPVEPETARQEEAAPVPEDPDDPNAAPIEIDDIEAGVAVAPQDMPVNPQEQREATKYKHFEPIKVPDFEVIRLALTPSWCHSFYQTALARLLYKARNKVEREMDISQVLWKITNSERLTRSFERHEIFKGLKKRYKNKYPNVVHVSLLTEESIM